eukprot:12006697-Ditylum_brightwellii.AAC.1
MDAAATLVLAASDAARSPNNYCLLLKLLFLTFLLSFCALISWYIVGLFESPWKALYSLGMHFFMDSSKSSSFILFQLKDITMRQYWQIRCLACSFSSNQKS